jgi:mutator protein MutT
VKRTTLTFVIDGDRLLMILKKRGQGAGKWNLPGGKIAEGETAEQAAAREVREETGLQVADLQECGNLEFLFPAGGSWSNSCTVFRTSVFSGILTPENDECSAHWVSLKEIPYDRMWPNDRLWVPSVLAGGRVDRTYTFDAQDQLVSEVVRR